MPHTGSVLFELQVKKLQKFSVPAVPLPPPGLLSVSTKQVLLFLPPTELYQALFGPCNYTAFWYILNIFCAFYAVLNSILLLVLRHLPCSLYGLFINGMAATIGCALVPAALLHQLQSEVPNSPNIGVLTQSDLASCPQHKFGAFYCSHVCTPRRLLFHS